MLESEGPLDAIPIVGWLSIPSNGISVALAMIFFSYARPQKEELAHDARGFSDNADEDQHCLGRNFYCLRLVVDHLASGGGLTIAT